MTNAQPLRLILTRHAKSSWKNPTLADHDRSLNARGRRSATAIGQWIASHDYCPDNVLCSTAQRARETWDGIRPGCKTAPENVSFSGALYLASAEMMLKKLKQAPSNTLLLIAHNPGIARLASMLAASRPDHPRFADYPSGATTVFGFNLKSWQDLQPGSGAVLDFITPREVF